MFTGFASENTPAIQVWDFGTFPSPPTSTVSLVNDCAPIQVFKTGATVAAIFVYLPSAPVEGKQLKIINVMRGANGQPIHLFSSDRSGNGSASPILIIGVGQTVDLCYSKEFISKGSGGATYETGWVTLNFAPPSSTNYSSVVLAGENNRASSTYASVVSGTGNIASGSYSSVLSGANNTASGSYASVAGGSGNTSSGVESGIFAGSNHTASGQYAAVFGGVGNSSTARAFVIGGQQNTSNATNSICVAGAYGNARSIIGNVIFTASDTPIAFLSGGQQLGTLLLGRQTTNATATVLTSNTSAAATTNQVILPNNSAYFFRGEVIAGVTGAGDTKGWTVEGVIKRGANAASTALVGTPTVTSSYADAGASAWTITATADTTNGGLAITVTGAAATTIRWVAQIRTTEMTY